jgi:hypothetical protein
VRSRLWIRSRICCFGGIPASEVQLVRGSGFGDLGLRPLACQREPDEFPSARGGGSPAIGHRLDYAKSSPRTLARAGRAGRWLAFSHVAHLDTNLLACGADRQLEGAACVSDGVGGEL